MLEGFEIQSPEKQFVSWDTTYDEMKKLPFVKLDESNEYLNAFCFTFPVRLGDILLENFKFYTTQLRTDIAVYQYEMAIKNPPNAQKLYQDFKQKISKNWKLENDLPEYKQCYFSFGDLTLTLLFYTENGNENDTCGVQIYIYNHKDYPHLLLDFENEEKMQISDFLIINKNFWWEKSYKTYDFIKRRPPMVTSQFGEKTLFWRDDKNQILGIAAGEFSASFALKNIEKVEIFRTLPAKGGGGDVVALTFIGEKYAMDIIGFPPEKLDFYAPKLEKLIGKKIKIINCGYDC